MVLTRQHRTSFGIGLSREDFELVANGTGNRVPYEEGLAARGMLLRVLEDGTRPQRFLEIRIFDDIRRLGELSEHAECRDAVIHRDRRCRHFVGSLDGEIGFEGMVFGLAFDKPRRLGKCLDAIKTRIGQSFPRNDDAVSSVFKDRIEGYIAQTKHVRLLRQENAEEGEEQDCESKEKKFFHKSTTKKK